MKFFSRRSQKKKLKDASTQERVASAYQQILFWIKACMLLVDEESLIAQRANLGMQIFFIGSADYLCQNYELDDATFGPIAVKTLKAVGVAELEAQIIVANYPNIRQNEFGSDALLEGGKRCAQWFTRKNSMAPMVLASLMREWSETPDVPEDLNETNLTKHFVEVTGL